MLTEMLDSTDFYNKLKNAATICPIPKASDRKSWDFLESSLKEDYIKKAEAFFNYDYPSLLPTRYMEYVRNGNRSHYESDYFNRRTVLQTLIIGECLEYKGRFIDDIINGILLICEETSWVGPAHNNDIILGFSDEIHIDIFSSETGSLLCFAYFLLEKELNNVSPLITYRIKTEIENRILKPYMENDFWWMSFGSIRPYIWNTWCNANCLAAFLIIEEDTDIQQKAIHKIARSLDKFMDCYNKDGGCAEGVSNLEQTGGCLFDAFELLVSIDEELETIFTDEKINNIFNFPYKAHIDKNFYFNFADSATKINFDSHLLYRIGKRTKNDTIMQFSKYLYEENKTSDYERVYFEGRNLFRQITGLFVENFRLTDDNTNTDFEKLKDVYFNGIEVMVARQNQSSEGLYLAAKGSNNNKDGHNDVGSFIVYKDGNPLLIDVGVEVYTKKTFSSQRYEIWTMQSQYHNLPTFSGIMQKVGSNCSANNVTYICTDNQITFSLNIEDAYGDFNVKKVSRLFNFYRGDSAYIELTDDFELVSHEDDTFYNFMCSQKPSLIEPGNVEICAGGSKINLYYNAEQFSFAYEEIEIDDLRLSPSWGTKIYRIVLTLLNHELKGKVYFKII